MDLQLTGKKALVIGASRGLGAEICQQLAAEGVQVFAVARDHDKLMVLKQKLKTYCNMEHYSMSIDLLIENGVTNMNRFVRQHIGTPDIIVHNLGGTLGIRDAFASNKEFQQVWQFNLGVAIDINNQFLPEMQTQGWGRIVHVSSSASVKVDASLAYCSAKAALNAYVVGLGRAVANKGVVACAVLPGPFQYEGSQWDLRSHEQPEMYRQFVETRMPLGRLGRTEDIAGIITFLSSEQGKFFSGALVPVDGGIR